MLRYFSCNRNPSTPYRRKATMKRIIMYTTARCPYCLMAERLLASKGIENIEKIRVDLQPERFEEMLERTRRRTVPQIFIGEVHVGGYQDLAALNHQGRLDELLQITRED